MNLLALTNVQTSQQPVRGNSSQGQSSSTSFSNLLGRFEKQIENSVSPSLSTGVVVEKDNEEHLDVDLIKSLQLLVSEIPIADGYLNREMLNDEDIQKLLELFPEELKLQIEQFFIDEVPLEALVQSIHGLSQPANMIALLIGLNQTTQHMNGNELLRFQRHLEQMLKLDEKLTADTIKDTIRQLAVNLEKNQTNPKQSEFLNSLIQRLGTERPIEGKQGLSQIGESGQAMSRVQQFVIHVGEQPTKEAEQRQFLRQFQEVLGRGILKNLNGNGTQMSIKLFPEHLGRLDIRLTQLNGVITAKIMASSNAAREIIESQVQQLRNAFGQQQLNVDRIEITMQQQSHNLNKDGQGRQQQEREEQEQQEEVNPELFSDLLNEISINEKV